MNLYRLIVSEVGVGGRLGCDATDGTGCAGKISNPAGELRVSPDPVAAVIVTARPLLTTWYAVLAAKPIK